MKIDEIFQHRPLFFLCRRCGVGDSFTGGTVFVRGFAYPLTE